MAKNDNKGKPRVAPTTIQPNMQKTSDEWKDEEAEAEVRSADADTRARMQSQSTTQAEVETYKEGFFEKVVHKVKDALHIDTPDHMSHATPAPTDPQHAERIREAHKVELGSDGADLKGLPINKVPGKLRKFVSK